MFILAIDTSTKYLSLAIAQKDKISASFHRDLEQQHCARLIPQIDRLLKKVKIRLKDIGCVAFSKGPGSFTGLRIGTATVKGLALAPPLHVRAGQATKIKIVGVPTLDVLAQERAGDGRRGRGLASEPSLIVPIIDAKRGNVYSSIYSFSGGRLKRHMRYSVLPVSELLKKIKTNAIFLGDGLVPYRKTIEDNFKFKAEFANEKKWYPRAITVAEIGYGLIKEKKFEDPDKFVPMYLYPKDVQVKQNRKL